MRRPMPHTQTNASHADQYLTRRPIPHTQTNASHADQCLTRRPMPHTQTNTSHADQCLTRRPMPTQALLAGQCLAACGIVLLPSLHPRPSPQQPCLYRKHASTSCPSRPHYRCLPLTLILTVPFQAALQEAQGGAVRELYIAFAAHSKAPRRTGCQINEMSASELYTTFPAHSSVRQSAVMLLLSACLLSISVPLISPS